MFAGAGHANIVALRGFARRRVAAEIILVNDGKFAWYTGALPALIRGEIAEAEARIDVAVLAARAGAGFIDARVVGFADGVLRLEGGGNTRDGLLRSARNDDGGIAFDILALSVGGAKMPGGVKPIPEFLARVAALAAMAAPRVGIIGAGAAGVELALSLRARLGAGAVIYLSGRTLLPGAAAAAKNIARAALAEAWIEIVEALPAGLDEVVRAYTPVPDLMIESSLLVAGETHVFASGDCARFAEPLPRSGAVAVAQGRLLADNLRRCLRGQSLRDYKPRAHHLAIMRLDEDAALAWYGKYAVAGAWPLRLKRWLDARWLRQG